MSDGFPEIFAALLRGEFPEPEGPAVDREGNRRAQQGSREARIARHLACIKPASARSQSFVPVPAPFTHCFVRKTESSAADLGSLRPISIAELRLGEVHRGRVLLCRVIVRCNFMKSAMTLVEDACGDVADIAVYNFPGVRSLRDAQRLLPEGRRLAIKEPFFKARADGTWGVRVDDPEDLVLDPPPQDTATTEAPGSAAGPDEPLRGGGGGDGGGVEARLVQLARADPGLGQKRLHRLLQDEGYAISQLRVRKLLAEVRSSAPPADAGGAAAPDVTEATAAAHGAARAAEHPTPPSAAAARKSPDDGGATPPAAAREGTESDWRWRLPDRQPQEHRLLRDPVVAVRRSEGNAAIAAGKFEDAERIYSEALKAARAGSGGTDAADDDGGDDAVPLWALYSNRSLARLRLDLPDKAMDDALKAHTCAPLGAVRPVLRCAEAMAALGLRPEAQAALLAAAPAYPEAAGALAQKQQELAPTATLRVGAGEAYASIAAAVAAAPPGAEILVRPGVYREPLLLTRRVAIRSLAVEPNEHWALGAPEGEALAEIRVSSAHAVNVCCPSGSVCLRGFRIVCDGAPAHCLHAVTAPLGVVVLQGCLLTSSSGPALAADAGARVVAQSCAVHDGAQGGVVAANGAALVLFRVFCCRAAASGLELRRGATASLLECSFFANGQQGLFVWQGAGALEARRCEVHSNENDSGVLVEETEQTTTLRECKLYGNGFAGAAVQEKGSLKLVRCKVHENLEGVLIQSSGNGKVEHCTIFNNHCNGVFVGYDHTGSAAIIGNEVHDNSGKGILLGTGIHDRITVRDNEQRGNRGMGCMRMPPGSQLRRERGSRSVAETRAWAKNVKKSGGSFEKAAQASTPENAFDAFMTAAKAKVAGDMPDPADLILACGFCKKQPGKEKFKKCSNCLAVSYCSAKCQKSHWKAGHKEACKPPPPRYPSFVDPTRSVNDGLGDAGCPAQ